MLTPQEVAEHVFSKATFGGYNMAMVDEFLDLLTADYTALFKENTALKAKMKVLADKVEEYRSTEDAMRKALLSAQKIADQMVSDAENKKENLLAQAELEARDRLAGVRKEIEEEEKRLAAAKNATGDYVSKLRDLYQHEMDYLGGLSRVSTVAPKVDKISQAAEDIGNAVAHAVEEEIGPAAEEVEEPTQVIRPQQGSFSGAAAFRQESVTADDSGVPEEEEGTNLYESITRSVEASQRAGAAARQDESPTRRIDFENLKFGKDYEIK